MSFRSASDQDLKAAKYVVLIPGPGMFVNVRNAPRVVIAAPSGRPLFRRVSRCVRSFEQSRVCTHFHSRKQTWGNCAKTIFCRVILIDGSREGVFIAAFERPLKSV